VAPESFYTTIDHTADIGIEVEAEDLADIFRLCGMALFDIMFELDSILSTEQRDVGAEGDGGIDLLVAWLNELLYVSSVEGFLFCDFQGLAVGEGTVSARGLGERLDPGRHVCAVEVKAATYHAASIWQVEDRWKARVIFDI
jgi:SHS2 domain-containing protein